MTHVIVLSSLLAGLAAAESPAPAAKTAEAPAAPAPAPAVALSSASVPAQAPVAKAEPKPEPAKPAPAPAVEAAPKTSGPDEEWAFVKAGAGESDPLVQKAALAELELFVRRYPAAPQAPQALMLLADLQEKNDDWRRRAPSPISRGYRRRRRRARSGRRWPA